MMPARKAAQRLDDVFADHEPAGLTLAQRCEENERQQQKQRAAGGKPEQRRGETICLARRGAPVGVVCNPWESGHEVPYAPLADWIAKLPDLSAGDKRFHAACLRRWGNCKRRLPVDKLAAETATTRCKVYERIRKFIKLRLMKRDRFGNLQLLYRDKERDAEYGALEAGEHVSRIANEVMALPSKYDAQVIVYGRLCGMAGKEGWCWATNAKLMEACGCGRNALRRAVHGLEAQGLIQVDRPGKGKERCSPYKKRGGGANVYHFLGHAMFRQSRRDA